ncbi:MAG: prepilin-type N-terminal cleavage/methylation domain-containing protein, partial [Gammaproteobacteria bacterium]|nr:prepilin-type N-terminal cleavage/methylation domain-containing protein [Gammaproteobacteria bacterium]
MKVQAGFTLVELVIALV